VTNTNISDDANAERVNNSEQLAKTNVSAPTTPEPASPYPSQPPPSSSSLLSSKGHHCAPFSLDLRDDEVRDENLMVGHNADVMLRIERRRLMRDRAEMVKALAAEANYVEAQWTSPAIIKLSGMDDAERDRKF
jgi:hypothetical protein